MYGGWFKIGNGTSISISISNQSISPYILSMYLATKLNKNKIMFTLLNSFEIVYSDTIVCLLFVYLCVCLECSFLTFIPILHFLFERSSYCYIFIETLIIYCRTDSQGEIYDDVGEIDKTYVFSYNAMVTLSRKSVPKEQHKTIFEKKRGPRNSHADPVNTKRCPCLFPFRENCLTWILRDGLLREGVTTV